MASANKDDRILDVLENRLVERLYQRILQREEGVDSRGGAARRPARGRSGRSRSESHRGRRPRRRSLSGYRQHYRPRQCPHTDGEEDDEGGDGGGGDGSHRGHRGYPWKRARCDSDEKMKKEREVLRYGGKEGRARRPQHEADVSSRSLVSMRMHTQGGDKGDKGPREGTRGKGGGHGGTQWPRGGLSDYQSDGRGGNPEEGADGTRRGPQKLWLVLGRGRGILLKGCRDGGGEFPRLRCLNGREVITTGVSHKEGEPIRVPRRFRIPFRGFSTVRRMAVVIGRPVSLLQHWCPRALQDVCHRGHLVRVRRRGDGMREEEGVKIQK